MSPKRVPALVFASLFVASIAFAQTDPGVRGGGAAAGGPLPSVAANSPVTILDHFNTGKGRFLEVDDARRRRRLA